MSHSPLEILRHVLLECDVIAANVGRYDRDSFLKDLFAQRAFTRSLSVVGEAVWKLRRDHPGLLTDGGPVPWGQIAGMRHRIVHDYMDVNYDVVWRACTEEIVPLRAGVSRMVAELEAEAGAAPAPDPEDVGYRPATARG